MYLKLYAAVILQKAQKSAPPPFSKNEADVPCDPGTHSEKSLNKPILKIMTQTVRNVSAMEDNIPLQKFDYTTSERTRNCSYP